MEVWIYGYIYVYIDVLKCGYVDISIYGYMYLWIYVYMDRVHDVFHDVYTRFRSVHTMYAYGSDVHTICFTVRVTNLCQMFYGSAPRGVVLGSFWGPGADIRCVHTM